MEWIGPGASLFFLLSLPSAGWCAGPDGWIPARWLGGPLELEQRVRTKSAPTGAGEREALEEWYDSATLDLLKGSPINCLLVTWSGIASEGVLRRQHELVTSYTLEAHRRGLSVVGLIYAGGNASQAVASAAEAALDGVAFEGDSAADLAREATRSLAGAAATAVVIPIHRDASAARAGTGPIAAVMGVSPSARRLADMGIRAGPSSEPWIESNIWLVRSFHLRTVRRPVWIGYQIENGSAADYARAVADAAVAGGHWIVAPDDRLRGGLWRREAAAIQAWRRISDVLRFARDHAQWSAFTPYGNLAIVFDNAERDSNAEEYLKLAARRQVPYRLLSRAQLSADSLSGFIAALAVQLTALSQGERDILRAFAEKGGTVIVGPAWGDAPQDQRYAERVLGKGRVVVYKDPDPESVAHDLRDLLSQEEMGVTAFNVPSVITSASASDSGRHVLVHLLNYSTSPAEAITIRVQGKFNAAWFYTPDAAPSALSVQHEEGHTDVTIPRLPLWGAMLLKD